MKSSGNVSVEEHERMGKVFLFVSQNGKTHDEEGYSNTSEQTPSNDVHLLVEAFNHNA